MDPSSKEPSIERAPRPHRAIVGLLICGALGWYLLWPLLRKLTVYHPTTCTVEGSGLAVAQATYNQSPHEVYSTDVDFSYRIGSQAYECQDHDLLAPRPCTRALSPEEDPRLPPSGQAPTALTQDAVRPDPLAFLAVPASFERPAVERLAAGYPPGTRHECWYDPADPRRVLLRHRVEWYHSIAIALLLLGTAACVLDLLRAGKPLPPSPIQLSGAAPDRAPPAFKRGQSAFGCLMLLSFVVFVGLVFFGTVAYATRQGRDRELQIVLPVILGLCFLGQAFSFLLDRNSSETLWLRVRRRALRSWLSTLLIVLTPAVPMGILAYFDWRLWTARDPQILLTLIDLTGWGLIAIVSGVLLLDRIPAGMASALGHRFTRTPAAPWAEVPPPVPRGLPPGLATEDRTAVYSRAAIVVIGLLYLLIGHVVLDASSTARHGAWVGFLAGHLLRLGAVVFLVYCFWIGRLPFFLIFVVGMGVPFLLGGLLFLTLAASGAGEGNAAVGILGGAVFFLAGIGMTVVFLKLGLTEQRKHRARLELFRSGNSVQGLVADVRKDSSVSVNRRSPWSITYSFEVGGRSFKGQYTSWKTDPPCRPDDRPYVLYLPQDPAQNTLYLPPA